MGWAVTLREKLLFALFMPLALIVCIAFTVSAIGSFFVALESTGAIIAGLILVVSGAIAAVLLAGRRFD